MTPDPENTNMSLEDGGESLQPLEPTADQAENIADGMLSIDKKAELIEGFQATGEAKDALSLTTAKDVVDGLEQVDDLDKLLDKKRIEDLVSLLKTEMEKIKDLKPEEKEEFVTNNRQKLTELKFLRWYVQENGLIVERDSEEFWDTDDGEYNLTALDREVKAIEDTLSEVMVLNEETGEEESVYENLEGLRDTISVKEFLKLPLEKRLALVSNIKSKDLLKPNTLLVFDFGNNGKLERHIGLGDLMPNWVRSMTIGSTAYARRGGQGFYDKGKYLAIFTGSEVSVGEVNESYSPKEEYKKKYSVDYAEAEVVKNAGGVEATIESTEVTYGEVAEIAEDFLVDAFFLQSILEIKKSDPDTAASSNYDFVHMAARYIQNAEAKFEELDLGSAMHESGRCYNEKFITYAMDRFGLFNDYSPEQESVIHAVISRYAELTGVELKTRKVEGYRRKMNPRSNKRFRRRVSEKGFGGAMEFEMPHGGKGIEMLRDLKAWESRLRATLRAKNVPEGQINMTVYYSRQVYENMRSRMGSFYNSQVSIRSYDGEVWTIKNSCVGGSMSFSQSLPFRVMRGLQKGRRFASNYRWGNHKREERGELKGGFHYIRSLIPDDSMLEVERDIHPGNVDDLVGKHLAVGEPAVAGLWNHAIWLYKRPDGTVMVVHSGADVRPRKIPASSVSEAPAGYVLQGDSYVRKRGSKVNELPFREFLARRSSVYGGGGYKSVVKLVTMSNLVQANLNYAVGSSEFVAYYKGNKNSGAA